MSWLNKISQNPVTDLYQQIQRIKSSPRTIEDDLDPENRQRQISNLDQQIQQQLIQSANEKAQQSPYLHHGTTTLELPQIQQSGLTPQSTPWSMQFGEVPANHVFLTFYQSEAEKYAQGIASSQQNVETERGDPVLLRVATSTVIPWLRRYDLERIFNEDKLPLEVSTPQAIPANILEVSVNNGWIPLSQWGVV